MPAYTWATGETITAAKLNTLETEAWRSGNQIASGTVTTGLFTSSTAYVDTGVSVTFTAKSSSVYVLFSPGSLGVNSTTDSYAILGININSTDYRVCHNSTLYTNASRGTGSSAGILISGLTPGVSYTAKGRIAISNATRTAYINYYSDERQTISVFEISK